MKLITTLKGLFAAWVPATASVDGYLKKEDFSDFAGKQDALSDADATHDGVLTKEDWSAFNGKQAALTSPLQFVAAAPASATAAGVKGQCFFDGTDVYLCTAENTWIKGTLTLATWS